MKNFIIVLLLVVGAGKVSAASDVCIILADAVSRQDDRVANAQVAMANIDFICSNDSDPMGCIEQIKREHSNAVAALKKAKEMFFAAGCGDTVTK